MRAHKHPFAARMGVLSRLMAGVFGGYALAAAATVFLGLVLPFSKGEAVLSASMLAFTVQAGAVIWAFAASSAFTAWYGILLPAAVMTLWACSLAGLTEVPLL